MAAPEKPAAAAASASANAPDKSVAAAASGPASALPAATAGVDAVAVLEGLRTLSSQLVMLSGSHRDEAFKILTGISEAWNGADLEVARKEAEEAAKKRRERWKAAEEEAKRQIAAKKAAIDEARRKAVAEALAAKGAAEKAAAEAAEKAKRAIEAAAREAAANEAAAKEEAALVEKPGMHVSGKVDSRTHSILASISSNEGVTLPPNDASPAPPGPCSDATATGTAGAAPTDGTSSVVAPIDVALASRVANPYLVEKALCVKFCENPVRMKDVRALFRDQTRSRSRTHTLSAPSHSGLPPLPPPPPHVSTRTLHCT